MVVINRLKPVSNWVKTLTHDNGKEFADHATIDRVLGLTTDFSDPCLSWQGDQIKT